jgi:hypothetical protein
MPYVPGGGKIEDVYHSGNVYVNNVPIALWEEAVASTLSVYSTLANTQNQDEQINPDEPK